MNFEDYRKELQQNPEYLEAEKELKPLLDLADEILSLRLEKGWSQSELARRTGTKQANISKIESGLANPTIQFIKKVAGAFDADLVVQFRKKSQKVIQKPVLDELITVSSGETSLLIKNWPQREGNLTTWTDNTSASSMQTRTK